MSEQSVDPPDSSANDEGATPFAVGSSWSIQARPASSLRPGMLCFVPSRQEFSPVLEVTRIAGENPVVFIDISDGRTLQFALSDEVFVRIPPHLA